MSADSGSVDVVWTDANAGPGAEATQDTEEFVVCVKFKIKEKDAVREYPKQFTLHPRYPRPFLPTHTPQLAQMCQLHMLLEPLCFDLHVNFAAILGGHSYWCQRLKTVHNGVATGHLIICSGGRSNFRQKRGWKYCTVNTHVRI